MLAEMKHRKSQDGDRITGLDDACEFPGREGVREREPDDLVLHMGRHARVD